MNDKTKIMTFHLRLTSIIFLFILCTTSHYIFSQNSNTYSLNYEINISKTNASDVIWERIPLPEGEVIGSMQVLPGNKLYIDCISGYIYQLDYDEWELINPDYKVGSQIEEYLMGGLISSSASNNYIWDYSDWTEIPKPFYGIVTKTFNLFFGGGGFEELYRSSDGCYNWDFVYDFGGCELVNGIVATSPDSIFVGYKNFCTGEGGLLLSIDSGYNFNPFGLHTQDISSLAIDNSNHIYAGSHGNWDYTELPGLYKYNYQTEIWDMIIIHPTISCIEFNTENHIFLGYGWEDYGYASGVMHSEDGGVSWIYDTIGMGYGIVWDLQIAENGIMYAIAGYPTKHFYRTVSPVEIDEKNEKLHLTTKCFPNPTSNKLTIATNEKFNVNKSLKLSIYNTTGLQILDYSISKREFSNGFIDIDVSDLERGVYIYCIKGEDYISTNRFIKQ